MPQRSAAAQGAAGHGNKKAVARSRQVAAARRQQLRSFGEELRQVGGDPDVANPVAGDDSGMTKL
jgi:hypothetical protein